MLSRVVATLTVAALLCAACGPPAAAPVAGGPESSPATQGAGGAQDAGGDVEVVEVVDGDTLRVRMSGTVESVRLIGINAPERDECLGTQAGDRLRVLVGATRVRLVPDVSDRDQYGRLLRYVYAGEVFVNAALVQEGFALARRYPPDLARAGELEAAQERAQDGSLGMWSADACGPPTEAGIDIVEVVWDAKGDDAANLNGEFAVVRNAGADAADLTGWVLKDESATHRYPFPPGFFLEAGTSVRVSSGCGSDDATTLFWCAGASPVWNNDGDTAFVVDPSGNVVDAYSY